MTTAYSTPSAGYYQSISSAAAQTKRSGNAPSRAPAQGQGNQVLTALLKSYLPTAGLYGLQGASIQQELGLVGTELGLNNAYQTAMAGYQLGQLGIRSTQLGLSGLGLQQEQSLYGILNPLERQQYGISQAAYGTERAEATSQERTQLALMGLERRTARTEARFARTLELTEAKYAKTLSLAKAALTHRNTLLQERGNIAAGGAQGSTGAKVTLTTIAKEYGMQVGTIKKQYGYETKTITQQYKKSLLSITRTYQFGTRTLERSYTYQMRTLTRQKTLSQLGQVGTLAQQKYTTEQLTNAKKNLALLAKSNGLSQQEVMTRLNYAISSGQLGAEETVIGLLTKLGGVWTGAETGLATTLGEAGYVNGLNMFTPPRETSAGALLQPEGLTPLGMYGTTG